MIQVASGTKVYLALRPLSMRYGFDGLSARVSSILHQDPFSGHLFIFRSKRGDYLKILHSVGCGVPTVPHWASSGFCLFAKRLDKGLLAFDGHQSSMALCRSRLVSWPFCLKRSTGDGRCSRHCRPGR